MIEQEMTQVMKLYDLLVEFFVNYSFQLFGAIVIFIIGLYVAKKASQFFIKTCTKHNIDITLTNFLANILRITIIIMVAIICLGKLGVSVTPFVAAIGAASLGAGLAFQGLLSNYGAGLTIIITRPFVIGNTISVQGITGVVKDITLGATYLTNEDEELITIPNKFIVGEILHNSQQNKLIETVIGVAYDTNLDDAIAKIKEALSSIAELAERTPQIGVDEFGDSSINIGIRFWAPTTQYFHVRYQANFAIYQALKQANITIPFPQREVRLLDKDE